MFDNQDQEVHSLTQAAVILVTYVFLVLILYFVLSTPVNMIFDGFDSTNWAAAEPQHAGTMSNIRQTWTIFCAIFISIPLCWFFFWVFHREPRWGPSQGDNNQWR